jgi:hypothetical protein
MTTVDTATAPTSRAQWEKVVAALNAANVALNLHPYCKAHPEDANYEMLEQDHAYFLRDANAALGRVFATPAPDADGIAEKLEIYAKEFEADEALTAIIAEARRFLTGQGGD